jgi:nucleotide-binding universal stress UspA family protein
MKKKEKPAIVIPLDGSFTSATAFNAAQALTKIMNATLHVVHVTEAPIPESQLLKHLKVGPVEVESLALHQLSGEVVEAIHGFASSIGAKMIVMSGQGETNNPERLVGGTALNLMQLETIPIMVIRAAMKKHPDASWRPGRMLVPLEGSPLAACVINQVFSLAKVMGADIDILHIAMLGKKPPAEVGTFTTPRYIDHPQYDWSAWADEFLSRFYTYLYPEAKLRLFLREGDPVKVTLHFAGENNEDLIALSWRGRLEGKFASTVKGILQRANLPVLLIRT